MRRPLAFRSGGGVAKSNAIGVRCRDAPWSAGTMVLARVRNGEASPRAHRAAEQLRSDGLQLGQQQVPGSPARAQRGRPGRATGVGGGWVGSPRPFPPGSHRRLRRAEADHQAFTRSRLAWLDTAWLPRPPLVASHLGRNGAPNP